MYVKCFCISHNSSLSVYPEEIRKLKSIKHQLWRLPASRGQISLNLSKNLYVYNELTADSQLLFFSRILDKIQHFIDFIKRFEIHSSAVHLSSRTDLVLCIEFERLRRHEVEYALNILNVADLKFYHFFREKVSRKNGVVFIGCNVIYSLARPRHCSSLQERKRHNQGLQNRSYGGRMRRREERSL